jgi:NADPH:quinone reductase
MLAAWYEQNGTAAEVLQVGEFPDGDPQPGAGEVLVKLEFSGVNPSDVKSRRARPLGGPRVIPHSDGAGVIVAVGADVDNARVGERVWIWNGQWKRALGTAAQLIALPSAQAVLLPCGTTFEAGACAGIPLLTAWHALSRLGDIRGKTILVIGAASSVGDYVTQLASRDRGAAVIGTVGSELKAAHARRAGAAHTIDYKTEDVAARILELTDGRGVDAVIDMDFSTTAPLGATGAIANHSIIVSYGSNVADKVSIPYREYMFRCLSVQQFAIYELTAQQREQAVAGVSEVLAADILGHTIAEEFELADIVAAHEAVESGNGGKPGNVIVRIP